VLKIVEYFLLHGGALPLDPNLGLGEIIPICPHSGMTEFDNYIMQLPSGIFEVNTA